MIASLLFLPVLLLALATIDALIARRRARESNAMLERMAELCPHMCAQCAEDAYQAERWSQ